MKKMLYQDTLPPGCHWSFTVRRGHALRLTDSEGGANLSMLMYNPYSLLERINVPDTLKCQHTFKLTAGHCIYSDMGRVFCSITEDTAGWHDAVCGTSNKALVDARWGKRSYQQARNDMHRNGIDSFLIELAKYGLGKKDLAANLNLFSRVETDDDGNLCYVPNAGKAGASVTLRFEMDTLVVMHSCPHPLDPAQQWPAKPVLWQLGEAEPLGDHDLCQHACGENERGFINNALYHLSAPGGLR